MRQTVALSGHLMTVERNLALATAAASEGARSADVLHAIDPDRRGAILWQHVLEWQRPRRHSMGTRGGRQQRLGRIVRYRYQA
jgi:hypothetical protein